MQIRVPEAPSEAAPASGERVSKFLQIPSRGEGRLARRAVWTATSQAGFVGDRAKFCQRAR
eukprot:1228412-Alexandrium_andersonii.AAC.1